MYLNNTHHIWYDGGQTNSVVKKASDDNTQLINPVNRGIILGIT